MTRFHLRIEYDGRDYLGWQRQPQGPTIQQALEDAVATTFGKVAPVPGAFFEHAGERIRVLAGIVVEKNGRPGEVLDSNLTIACEQRALRPLRVQRAGRGVMDSADLLRGFPLPAGTLLT